jgi:hypothetical protein
MALDILIPRIEWNDISIVGDTHTSTTIDGIADTTLIKVDMVVTGSGIPTDTRVVSKTSSSILLSKVATSTLSDTTLSLFERFDFTYAPSKDSEDQPVPSLKETRSLSGEIQTKFDYLEYQRQVVYDHLTQTKRDVLRDDFYAAWAVYGNDFRYYYDKADSAYKVYILKDKKPDFDRQIKKHPYFLYQVKLSFMRVV